MADDVAGAVRRTPRPTGDHQTPETGPQVPASATITPTPVSGDHLGVREGLTGDLRIFEVTLTEDIPVTGGRILSATLGDDVNRVVAEYAALPDCTACGGSGKDDHATAFEASLAVHFAGPPVRAERRLRQLCMWCGHVLIDAPLADEVQLMPWSVGVFVKVEDGYGVELHGEPGGELPPGCCALPDDETPGRTDQEDEHDQPADQEQHLGETRADTDWPAEPQDGDRG